MMKKNVKKSMRNVLFIAALVFGFTSCKEDPHAKITYSVVCSGTLLEYATPQVSYKANGCQEKLIPITDSEWTESTDVTTSINGEKKSIKKWTMTVTYDDFGVVDDEMTVTYIPNDKAKGVPTSDVGLVTHSLSASIEVRDKDENMHFYNTSGVNVDMDINVGSNILEDKIKSIKDHRSFHIEDNGTIKEK